MGLTDGLMMESICFSDMHFVDIGVLDVLDPCI